MEDIDVCTEEGVSIGEKDAFVNHGDKYKCIITWLKNFYNK